MEDSTIAEIWQTLFEQKVLPACAAPQRDCFQTKPDCKAEWFQYRPPLPQSLPAYLDRHSSPVRPKGACNARERLPTLFRSHKTNTTAKASVRNEGQTPP